TIAQRMTVSPLIVVHDGAAIPLSCTSKTNSRLMFDASVPRTPKQTIFSVTGALSSNIGLFSIFAARYFASAQLWRIAAPILAVPSVSIVIHVFKARKVRERSRPRSQGQISRAANPRVVG